MEAGRCVCFYTSNIPRVTCKMHRKLATAIAFGAGIVESYFSIYPFLLSELSTMCIHYFQNKNLKDYVYTPTNTYTDV